MKRLLGIGLMCGFLLACNTVYATSLTHANGTAGQNQLSYQAYTQQYLNEIGFRILNANSINKHIIFNTSNNAGLFMGMRNRSIWGVKDDVTDSNRTLFKNRSVVVYPELLDNATNDDEVAALISHEIAHCLKSYTGILRGSFHGIVYAFTAKRQNYEADLTAVNLMAKAGYNPVALITILNKTAGQYRFDIGENGLTTKRIRKINEYIKVNYPQYVSAYATNPYYKNAINIIAPAEQEKNIKNVVKKSKKTK